MKRLLCGDIGGTNARLQLWATSGTTDVKQCANPLNEFQLVKAAVFESKNFTNLADLVVEFLKSCSIPVPFAGVSIDGACIAMCGPVDNEERMCGPVLAEQPPTQWVPSPIITGTLTTLRYTIL